MVATLYIEPTHQVGLDQFQKSTHMATIREYFEADFNYAVRVHIMLDLDDGTNIEACVLYDLAANSSFFSCFVPGKDNPLEHFSRILRRLHNRKAVVAFDHKITLPAARYAHGAIQVKNENPLDVQMQFYGDSAWSSIREIATTNRIFIYTETQLNDAQIAELKREGAENGQSVQLRSTRHTLERAKMERPLAFISHDSRDKESIAKKIALNLQRLMCPVWYDEFSLNVGDHLRDTIEKGLKECKRCVLVLSPNFFANEGWTKREFDSIFTREILEKSQLVLPVWYGVTPQSVFDYSPSLLNVKGLDWNKLGEEETCRLLCQAITRTE
jgi:hypothetical protein